MLLSFRNFNIFFKFYLQSFNVNQLNYDFKICYKYIKLYFYNNCIFKFYTVPNQIKKFTVLKSPFVFKKSKEQFEVKTFKKYLSCKFDAYVKLVTLFLLIKTCIKNIFSLFKISINQFLNFN